MNVKFIVYMVGFLVIFAAPMTAFAKDKKSDDQIKLILVEQSRSTYAGICGCPDDVMASGKICAGRSSYSKTGGQSILCSAADVTKDMVDAYRAGPVDGAAKK